MKTLPVIDQRFRIGDVCNGCGICSRVCPGDNIRMAANRPEWLHHCLFCLGCINLCPKEAIQLEEKCRNRRRYHHHLVSIRDLIQIQKGERDPSSSEPAPVSW